LFRSLLVEPRARRVTRNDERDLGDRRQVGWVLQLLQVEDVCESTEARSALAVAGGTIPVQQHGRLQTGLSASLLRRIFPRAHTGVRENLDVGRLRDNGGLAGVRVGQWIPWSGLHDLLRGTNRGLAVDRLQRTRRNQRNA